MQLPQSLSDTNDVCAGMPACAPVCQRVYLCGCICADVWMPEVCVSCPYLVCGIPGSELVHVFSGITSTQISAISSANEVILVEQWKWCEHAWHKELQPVLGPQISITTLFFLFCFLLFFTHLLLQGGWSWHKVLCTGYKHCKSLDDQQTTVDQLFINYVELFVCTKQCH